MYFDKLIVGSHTYYGYYQATLLWHGFSQVNLLQSRRPRPLIITLIMTLIITLIPSSPSLFESKHNIFGPMHRAVSSKSLCS